MQAIDYFKLCLTKKYAEFTGRSRRSEFWNFALVCFIISIILYVPAILFTLMEVPLLGGLFMIIYFIVALGLVIPQLAAAVRRLHDTGRSGWWYFIILIPLVGVIALLVFLFQDSEPGSNKWGPNPKTGHEESNIIDQLV